MVAVNFRYAARTADGDIVRGSMHAPDVTDVVESLRARALFVTAVDPADDMRAELTRALRIGGIPRRALLAFFRSFATLVGAGVSIARALTVTIERTDDARLAETLRAVLADVEHGWALSAALARRPHDFPPLYIAMIRAGEAGGILDDVLDRLALFLEREAALRKKVMTALAYPAFVLCAAAALIVFMLATIVPMFAEIFAGFHVPLPPSTVLLLGAGNALRSPQLWLTLAAAVPIATLALHRYGRSPGGALALDRVRLQLPVTGPLLHKAAAARVARMLGTVLRSGVELTAAIDAVCDVAGSARYAHALRGVAAALRNGEALAPALTAARLFDPLLLALVSVGEEAGTLDDMLLTVASYFETDIEATVATLGALLEPALLLVLGSIVGLIVCSIFVPLYTLIGNVTP